MEHLDRLLNGDRNSITGTDVCCWADAVQERPLDPEDGNMILDWVVFGKYRAETERPNYLGNTDTAMQLINDLYELKIKVGYSFDGCKSGNFYEVELSTVDLDIDTGEDNIMAMGIDVPHAICVAVLRLHGIYKVIQEEKEG